MPVALVGPSGRIALDGPVYNFGQSPENQIVLQDPGASPRHATLQQQGQSYSLVDLGSANGTYLNEQRLTPNSPAFLKNGDRIRIGNTLYTYEETLVSSPNQAYEPTMLAGSNPSYNSSPSYDATVMASQTPPPVPPTPYGGSSQPAPNYAGYGQSSPGYPDQGVPPAPAYGQSAPNYPPQTPAQGVPPTPVYGQSSPGYPDQGVPPTPAYGQSAPSYPGYGQSSPSYPPQTPAQPYGGQSSPSYPGYGQPAPSLPPGYVGNQQPRKSNGGRIAVIILVILVILGGIGGALGYVLTRPKPVITAVTSQYTDGSTPVGATGTTFEVTGSNFSGDSSITFFLDGHTVAAKAPVTSTSKGAIDATLAVADSWSVGTHTLTAQDASNYKTEKGFTIKVVNPGESKTPGPNGAPTDSASGSIDAIVSSSDSNLATITLTVTGGADGGKVCSDQANGQPQTSTGTSSGLEYTEQKTTTCSGTYKSGKLTYTQTVTSQTITFTSVNVVCTVQTPYVEAKLDGTFTSATDISGTFSSDATSLNCDQGVGNSAVNASTGTWTGTATMK